MSSSSEREYRAGLIGCGYWGPNLLRNMRNHSRVDVVRVADLDPARRATIASRYGDVELAEEAAAIFEDPSIEVVVIATEASSHFDLVCRALQAGQHVLVEKPLALSKEQAVRLRDMAQESGRLLLVGHTFLYNQAVLRLKELVQSGELGDIRYLYSQRVNLGKVRQDIGVIWNLGPHDISILRFLFPTLKVARIRAHAMHYLQPGIEDLAFLLLEFEDGMVAHIHLSWLDPSKVRRMTVVGSRKMALYDDIAEDKLQIFDRGLDKADLSPHMGEFDSFGEFQLLTRAGDVYLPKLPPTEPLAAEIGHLVDCLDGAQPRSGADHAIAVVALLEAALISAREGGAPIPLNI